MVEVDPIALAGLVVSIVGIAAGAGIALGLMKRKVDDTADRLDNLLNRIIDLGIDSLGANPRNSGGDKKDG